MERHDSRPHDWVSARATVSGLRSGTLAPDESRASWPFAALSHSPVAVAYVGVPSGGFKTICVMGQRFVACDREQSFLMPPDVREWLPPRHLAWFVIDAVAEMDLEAFYAAYRVDGRSRPPYDPAMMVALLLYAYARGIRSSRVIERACEEDVAFRVLAAQQRPDHATIARFVERHQDAIAGLFGEVLTLCARSGLAKVGVIAVDGTKVQANASRNENLDYEQLAREIVEEAKADRRGRGRALRRGARRRAAAGVRDRAGPPRLAARGQAAPGGRARGEPAAGAARAARSASRGQAPPGGGALDGGARQPGLRGLPGARADEGSAGASGARRTPTTPPAIPEGRINVTDPDSRVVKGLRGFIQGYNAQAVTNEHQVVLAAEIETVGADFGHLEPMLDATQRELRPPASTRRPEVLLADAGYWHGEQMQRIVDRGIAGADPARHQPPADHPAQLGRRPLRRDAPSSWPPSAAASSTANASR